MAKKISLALLTRAAFGAEAAMRTALRIQIPVGLVIQVFNRCPADTRVDIVGAAGSVDRRLRVRLINNPN